MQVKTALKGNNAALSYSRKSVKRAEVRYAVNQKRLLIELCYFAYVRLACKQIPRSEVRGYLEVT